MSGKRNCVQQGAVPSASRRAGHLLRTSFVGLAFFAWGVVSAASTSAQVIFGDTVMPLDMAVGRSIPMTTLSPIQRVSLASPDIADVVLISDRELVLNASKAGVTDLIIWFTEGRKYHYRVSVHSPTDRKQVLLEVRMAEADRDLLREIGLSVLWSDQHTRVGTGSFATKDLDEEGNVPLLDKGQFATVLSVNEVDNLLGLLDVAEQSGRFRILAQPNIIAANGEEATFLAGGELPVPVAQPSAATGVTAVTIEYREFGIRLKFVPEILSRELVKLEIEPEVSNLDFGNAVSFGGFLIPALRTRRASTTLDLREGQTLAIAGLLASQTEKVNTGLPLLKDIPILGILFSSQRYQRNETELLILVTPRVIDPMSPPPPPPLPGEKTG